MTDPCVICIRNTDNKAKQGIFPCVGCKQTFCTQHVAVHRQELGNELDLVIGERNELQDLFDHRQDLPDTSCHMSTIDEWVKKTIAQVHQAADNARQRLISIAQEQRTNIKVEFTQLSKQLKDMREAENFFEQDIENMKNECSRLKATVNQVNTNINIADIFCSLNEGITFQPVKKTTTDVLSSVEDVFKHQKPYQQIKLPHDGTLCVGKSFALIKNKMDYSVVSFEDNSMRSISLEFSCEYIHCWSSYYSAYFCKNALYHQTIQFISALNRSRRYNMAMDSEGNIVNIACFTDSLLVVSNYQKNNTVIEEWRFIDSTDQQKAPSVVLVSRWRPPLSCSTNECIKKIDFNDKHIVLAINNSGKCPQNRLEFRTRGMLVLGHVVLDEDVDFTSISLLSIKDGWILGQKKQQNETRHYTFIDKDLHEHEQKILSTQNIEHIAVVDRFPCGQTLAIYRKRNDPQLAADINQRSALGLYKIERQ